jgi:hypothetical protein
METVGRHARAFLPEDGVGLRGPVSADDMESIRRGQVQTEAVKEVEETDIHLLRLSRQGVAKDMIDPAEFMGKIIPRLPIHRFEPFSRMGVEKRELPRGGRSGDFFEGRTVGRRHGPSQGGEASQPENLAAAQAGVKHSSSYGYYGEQ